MAINKVQYGNTTLIDLTDTTAVASDVAQGKYFYGRDGVRTEGTSTGGGVTPTGNIDITQAGVTDVTNYATATVPSYQDVEGGYQDEFYTQNNNRKWHIRYVDDGFGGWVNGGYSPHNYEDYSAVPYGTSITPTESAQTIGGMRTMMEGAVTVNAIPSNYVGTGITRRSSSDLTISHGAQVNVPSGYYESSAIKRISNATKRADNPITTTPTISVNQAGLITASVSSNATITPIYTAGFDDTDTVVYVQASGSATEQLTTKGATTYTPSRSTQTIASGTYLTGTQTINPIPSEYIIPSGTYTVSNSGTDDITNYETLSVPALTLPTSLGSSGSGTEIPITVPSGINRYLQIPKGFNNSASYYNISVTSGSEGTPTATKGSVSNHSVSVTPSVTNTAGYISGGTHNGTAVTVSASELVSGSQTLSDNGTYDVTNLAEVVVDVQGGGGGTIQVGTKTATPSTASSSIQFTGLSGNPTSFVVTSQADIATNTNGVTAVVFDGSALHGQTMTTQVTADTGFTKSYSSGTLTITATSAQFQANAYKLVYTYGGSASDIETADVQVGSGATSITFPVNGRPAYWSCIFKSDFSTSSGYQRVIAVANDGSSTYGLAMDSSAHASTAWTASYSGGNFTVTSSGTNNGGYFHQPGYYQLTYYVDDSAPSYQTKTATFTPTTSTQTQSVTADNGYDALDAVNITVNPIPSQYVVPTGNLPITQNGNNIDVANYATVSVNVSGGSSDVAMGTLTVASNVNTSTNTTIATTSTIGFTPKAFLFYRSDRSATSNHVNQASFVTLGSSYYVRTMTRYSSNALSTSGNANNWTTQTAGYLYFNSNTVYFRSSSSYILPAGTWYWVAIK